MDTLFGDDPAERSAKISAPDPGIRDSGDGRPLAVRVRPASLARVRRPGAPARRGSALRTAIEQGRPHSMVLYGPPGTGKTTLARIVAERSGAAFEELSAVQAGRAEVRAVIERAAHRRADARARRRCCSSTRSTASTRPSRTPCCRRSRTGLLTLIGATTENPAFEVNGALLSRLRVYALQALSAEEVALVLRARGRRSRSRWTRMRSRSSRRAAKATRAPR